MDTRRPLLVGLALHAALLGACSSTSSSTADAGDASIVPDGHPSGHPDTGKPHSDSGHDAPLADSGHPHDGAHPTTDTGTPTPDTGTPVDTGTPTPDTGTPDTGTPVDTGTPTPDTGTPSPDAGTVGGVPGGVAGPGTTLSGCEIFPPDNPWNVRVDGPNVQVVTTYTQIPQGASLHADFGDFTPDGYGIPYSVVPSTQANVQTTFGCFADESDPGPGGWTSGPSASAADCSGEGGGTELGVTKYPFFTGMEIEGNPAAGSGGTPGALPNDQHALVLQQGAAGGGCISWEAWNCVQNPAPFNCANGAKFDLTSNALRPAGWTSADAAGLSILAGLVRLVDVQAGAIHHAIRVTFQTTQDGYIPPATHAAGSKALGGDYPPMGLRLRLKASVDISTYPGPAQVVLTAMKQYGFIVADIGSNWYFQGDSNNGWNDMASDGADTWFDEITDGTNQMKGSDFEVVYTGDPVNAGL
jgi:hypothetical protein